MRLFVALTPPEDLRDRIREAVEPLREAGYPIRWIESDGYHLTLKFLGDVREVMIPVIGKALDEVGRKTPVFPVTLRGFGAFPTIRKPRVLWMGAGPSPVLRCLKQDLEWTLAERGLEREARSFHPHITLGRAAEAEGAGAFRGLDERAGALDVELGFTARSVHLMRSRLSSRGARYTVIGSSPLLGENLESDEDLEGAADANGVANPRGAANPEGGTEP
jgi:RNA 2',3'-cyclic 3'-phosphodiesterase